MILLVKWFFLLISRLLLEFDYYQSSTINDENTVDFYNKCVYTVYKPHIVGNLFANAKWMYDVGSEKSIFSKQRGCQLSNDGSDHIVFLYYYSAFQRAVYIIRTKNTRGGNYTCTNTTTDR